MSSPVSENSVDVCAADVDTAPIAASRSHWQPPHAMILIAAAFGPSQDVQRFLDRFRHAVSTGSSRSKMRGVEGRVLERRESHELVDQPARQTSTRNVDLVGQHRADALKQCSGDRGRGCLSRRRRTPGLYVLVVEAQAKAKAHTMQRCRAASYAVAPASVGGVDGAADGGVGHAASDAGACRCTGARTSAGIEPVSRTGAFTDIMATYADG